MPTAVEFFLKIDGIPGDSVDAQHKGEIELMSFSWAEQQTHAMGTGGGGGAGRVSAQDFHFTSHVSKASPLLFIACASGQHIRSAVLAVRKAGEQPPDARARTEFLKYTLRDILVSSYQTGDESNEQLPSDQFSFNFAQLTFEFVPQNPNGTPGQPIIRTFDFRRNVEA
jgi:type VI secretion system secreted protein Hcp